MSDISKCLRYDCPKAENCYRYTAKTGYWQYFIKPVVVGDECDHFWPNDNKKEENHQ